MNLKVDGIVGIGTCLSPASALIRELEESEIPVLLVDPETVLPFPVVEVDRAAATRSMLEFLWAGGHRRFGLAGFDPDYTYSAGRLEGSGGIFREKVIGWPGLVAFRARYGATRFFLRGPSGRIGRR